MSMNDGGGAPLTSDMLRGAMENLRREADVLRPSVQILHPATAAKLRWELRRIDPWPRRYDLFPAITRLEKRARRARRRGRELRLAVVDVWWVARYGYRRYD